MDSTHLATTSLEVMGLYTFQYLQIGMRKEVHIQSRYLFLFLNRQGILFHWNILIDIFYNSSVFLLSVTGQIASVSFEGNGASAGDTELYCKVSLYLKENGIKSYT